MREPELFSIIILAYRNEQYLRCAVDSVLAQDYPALELIVADDGSPTFDGAGIEAYIAAHRGPNLRRALVYQNPENLGTVRSINRALERAEGRYLKLLAADDALYDGQVLSRAKEALEASPDGIITTRVMKCGPDLAPRSLLRDGFARALPRRSPEEVFRRLCVHNEIVGVGVFFTRAFWGRFGPFDESYRLLEDWPTWLRVSREGGRIGFGDFIAAKYRCDVGAATGVNPAYLADKKRTFAREIRPYWKIIGLGTVLRSWLTMKLRDSLPVRKFYGLIFRR